MLVYVQCNMNVSGAIKMFLCNMDVSVQYGFSVQYECCSVT